MSTAQNIDDLRREVLVEHGAEGTVLDELLEANRCRVSARDPEDMPAFPLADEPHVTAWQNYAADSSTLGAWTSLERRFAQLAFPIREGMSQDEGYRQATRRGIVPKANEAGPGLELQRPEAVELELHSTIAGTVPVISTTERADFEALVQAFTARNEPRPVPGSMGACLVAGLNNWDRIRTYRERWEAAHESHRAEGAWGQEFKRLTARKELYQDRFVILSHGPYSNVSAADAGFDEDTWLTHSYAIRREHECTHYFTLRLFGRLQHNVLEELVADFVGLVHAFGSFSSDLALRFLGLEDHPRMRADGRLHNYRGDPPMSDGAFAVVQSLAVAATDALEQVARSQPACASDPQVMAQTVWFLSTLTLEELASIEIVQTG